MEPSFRSNRGFALLITITLLAFLVLLLVSLASLTRVETQVSANTQTLTRARQNALMALSLAQGRLQAAAGPDQSATATASLLATRASIATSKQRWTGVWSTQTANPAPVWMVSDPSPDPAVAAPALATTDFFGTDRVRLLGAASVDLSQPDNGIVLATQPLTPAGVPGVDPAAPPPVSGRYAYWVADEGVKARIDLVNPFSERSATTTGAPAVASYTPDTATQRRYSWLALRTGGELLARAPAAPASPSAADFLGDVAYPATGNTPDSANLRRDLTKIANRQQLTLLQRPGLDDTFLRRRYHDITVNSLGVLADSARGGLKLDLTAALLDASAPAGLGNDDPLFTLPTGGWSGTAPTRLPSWGALRSYVRWGDPDSGLSGATPLVTPRATTDQEMGVYPVLARTQLWVHAAVEGTAAAGQTVHALYFPAVVLWNPYDVKLAAQRYSAMIGCTTKTLPAWLNLRAADSAGTTIPATGTGDSTVPANNGWGFVIDCPVLEPGQAVIFTLPANQPYSTAPAARVLTPGWRPTFWHEPVLTLAPGASTINRILATLPSVSNTLCELRQGDTFTTGASARPSGTLLQIVRRGNLGGAGTRTIASGTWATSLATLFAGNPISGWFSQLQYAGNDTSNRGIQWLAHYNPAAPEVTRTALELQPPTGTGVYGTNPSLLTFGTSTNGSIYFPIPTSDGTLAFVGQSHTAGPVRTVLFHLPRRETGVLSLGALQHASVHPATGTYNEALAGYAASAMPAYAIGNSRADPRVNPTDPDGFPDDWTSSMSIGSQQRKFHFDLSYVLNQALWDHYFFSSIPRTGPLTFPLPQPRLAAYTPANATSVPLDEAALRDPLQAASRLLLTGAFNVHSTSIEAWRAVLASLRDTPVIRADGATAATPNQQRTPYPRSPYPQSDPIISGSATPSTEAVYDGFRSLTDTQLDALARQIVAQIQARGPFLGVAQFVNRTPTSPTLAHQLAGVLQAAIDATNLNTSLAAPISISGVPSDARFYPSAAAGSGTSALPGSLTQADILQALGPVLTARSDTFLVRAYGEAVNPVTGATEGRAWCEALLQRFPDYVNAADAASVWPPPQPDNQRFGRAFRIVSFRWLSPSDL